MTYAEIQSIAFATPISNVYHGSECLVAIQDNKGYRVASRDIANMIGYDVLVKVSIICNHKAIEVIDIRS